MPSTTLYDRTGANVGSVELHHDLFGAPVNEAVLHQVVIAQLAGRRIGTHDSKTRGEGRGAVFGPHPRSYEQRLPRKMKRAALRGALTAKLGDEAIRVIDTFGLEAIKTQDVAGVLVALKATGRVLVVAPAADEKLELSARNLPTVDVILADSLNVVDLINADIILIEQPSLARMQEVYA